MQNGLHYTSTLILKFIKKCTYISKVNAVTRVAVRHKQLINFNTTNSAGTISTWTRNKLRRLYSTNAHTTTLTHARPHKHKVKH